jgi:DegV family protein with EDD domain
MDDRINNHLFRKGWIGMQIVTDSGTDYPLASEYRPDAMVHIVPLNVQLGQSSFQDGEGASHQTFYRELDASQAMPTTSQPSAGQFASLYRELAAKDPDILSIHLSAGLSGTTDSAIAAAKMVPEAHVSVVDTRTLSVGAGWQVDAAVRAIRAGWSRERILSMLKRISTDCFTYYTLNELKYLIHGGRISHMKGLLASILQIKPIIGVDHETGKYVQYGQARSFQGALKSMVNLVSGIIKDNQPMRVQVVHTQNPDGADQMHGLLDKVLKCNWLKSGPISFVLGAHTGPSLVGVCFAPQSTFADLA